MKADLRFGNKQNRASIIEMEMNYKRKASIGLFSEVKNGKTFLSFYTDHFEKNCMLELPDEQWHFVALTYDGSLLKCYLDGVLRYEIKLNQALKASFSTCNIGGSPAKKWFYKGAIRDLSIWNIARSQTDIAKDMIPYHGSEAPFKLTPNTPGLVANFPLNEGTGTTFSNLKKSINGKLVNSPSWTKAIKLNPNVIDEGIWFFIQNKHDLKSDLEIPPRGNALMAKNKHEVEMAQIPMDYKADISAFLWRTIQLDDGSGRYKLVNKKLGVSYVLDCGKTKPTIGKSGNYSGQQWKLHNFNTSEHGTNVYTLSNSFISDRQALSFSNGMLKISKKNFDDIQQAWVLQPMDLSMKYHLPITEIAKSPHTKQLFFGNDFTLYGTNTTSDWAMLNAHLIYKNMQNALMPSALFAMRGNDNITRREVNFISRFDPSNLVPNYPIIHEIWGEQTITDYRGSSGWDPSRNLSVTTITEEMMCKKGVFSRYHNGTNDFAYREYDQVIHEYGHALDFICNANGGAIPVSSGCLNSPRECFAATVQAWFNSNYSYTFYSRIRKGLPVEQKNFLRGVFQIENSWMPPRQFRETESSKQIASGTTLLPGSIYYSFTENYKLMLQQDGNLVVRQNDSFKWGSYNNWNVPLKTVTQVIFKDGWLIFQDSYGVEKGKFGIDAPHSRLVVSDEQETGNAFLKIVNQSGETIWTSK